MSLAPEIVVNLGLSYERYLNAVVLGLSTEILYTDDFEVSNFYIPGTEQERS